MRLCRAFVWLVLPFAAFGGPTGAAALGDDIFLDGFETGVTCAWSTTNPTVAETCDSLDNDCDVQVDEDFDFDASIDHCGGCNQPCVFANASALCLVGNCELDECVDLFDDCDANPATGCEEPLTTLTDCGTCATTCELANATEECSTGACLISTCSTGFAHCDGSHANGCEVSLNANPACGSPTHLGTVDGDGPDSPIATSTRGERWYTITVAEASSFPVPVTASVVLTSPPGVDYDLYVSCHSCAGTVQSGTSGGVGGVDTVDVGANDASGDQSFLIVVEVRYSSGEGCGNFTLTVTGDVDTTNRTCGP